MASPKTDSQNIDSSNFHLQEFKLYETQSKFYMIGKSESETSWRVLKIDRTVPCELNISEDRTRYSLSECSDVLNRIHAGNMSTGGLKPVMVCYGICGFIKFLGPYYMLLITKRRQIGDICGHKIYAIDKSELIPISNSTVVSNVVNSKDENRYKKLLCSVDLTKDFFFSYSYNVMCSLQKNLCNLNRRITRPVFYETMFVWNEFMTRGIRNQLKNTNWTVALVYGFYEQSKLSISGKDFQLALIARRSRHYAGTRYLKRGVNEKGRVANDVETEQIVFRDVSEGYSTKISSVVQIRGSIPVFWSQDNSLPNIKPEIILHRKDVNYEATCLHFENLVKRYGNPIIILNLIKNCEKKPHESILREEYANAIEFLNKDLSEENQLKFLHWDLSNHHKISNAAEVFPLMDRVATYVLNLTGFLYCQVTPTLKFTDTMKCSFSEKDHAVTGPQNKCNYSMDSDKSETGTRQDIDDANKNHSIKPFMLQKGVLRTNCIDCLDRTNVAQCVYGWAALLHQLHALCYIDAPKADPNDPLLNDLTRIYERMGDSLAMQYGGSAAINKLFSERRGELKAAIRSQEIFRTVQRYYNNACLDHEKQNAINVFLGHFQPQQGKPAIWEMDSDQNYNAGGHAVIIRNYKRSLSVDNVLHERSETGSVSSDEDAELPISTFPDETLQEGANMYSSLRTHLLPYEEPQRDGSFGSHSIYSKNPGLGDSNFLDLEWLFSSANSLETCERSSISNSRSSSILSENGINDRNMETPPPSRKYLSTLEFLAMRNWFAPFGKSANGHNSEITSESVHAAMPSTQDKFLAL